jgi:hypothetical protein
MAHDRTAPIGALTDPEGRAYPKPAQSLHRDLRSRLGSELYTEVVQPELAAALESVRHGQERGRVAGEHRRTSGVMHVVEPTQVRRPWRTTVRTAFQGAVALASLTPFVVAGVYGDATDPADYAPAIAQVLAVSSAVTRVMALPQVEEFLRRFAPFLAASR